MWLKLKSFGILALYLLSCFPVCYASETIFNPSSTTQIIPNWAFPERAYESDDNRSFTGVHNSEQEYDDYGFSFNSSCDIEEVYIGLEGYTTVGDSFRARIYNGSEWSNYRWADPYDTETLQWLNFTTLFTWDYSQVNNIKTRMQFGAAGCFPNQTYFITWDESKEVPWQIKRIDQAKVGDSILVYNAFEGIHFKKIDVVQLHNDTWEMYDIYSGEVKIKYKDGEVEKEYEWKHHGIVTGNHPVRVFRNDVWIEVNASSVELTDKTNHLYHNQTELDDSGYVSLKDHTLSLENIDRIRVFNFTGIVYDIKTNSSEDRLFMTYISNGEMAHLKMLERKYDVPLALYLGAIREQKWTYYVDWLPVKIIYSVEAATSFLFGVVGYSIAFLIFLVLFTFYVADIHK